MPTSGALGSAMLVYVSGTSGHRAARHRCSVGKCALAALLGVWWPVSLVRQGRALTCRPADAAPGGAVVHMSLSAMSGR